MPAPRRWLPAAACFLIPSVIFFPILYSGQMIFGSDVINVFLYIRMTIADAFRSGRLPIWDPHSMAGFPLLAGVQAAVFYPPSWTCIFLSAGTFWTLSVWGHLVLTGLFTYRWLEKGLGVSPRAALFGAAQSMLSGYLWTRVFLGHMNYIWAFPWVVAVLWRAERYLAGPTLKRGILLAIVFSMMVLSGVPQYVLFLALILAARSIPFLRRNSARRIDLVRCLGWLGLGLLACAPQVFPTIELAFQMQRGSGGDRAFFEEYSIDWRELPALLRGQSMSEGASAVGGAVALLMVAGLVWRRDQSLLWAGVSLFGVLMALGPRTPLYGAFTLLVPGSGQFRAPARYIVLFAFGATALASLGFDALWTRGTRVHRGLAVVLAAAGVLHLTTMNQFYFRSLDSRIYQWPSEWSRHLQTACGREYRVATAGRSASIMDVGRCREIGVDHVGGYDPMMLRRYAELINAVRGAPLDQNMPLLAAEAPHPAMDMLGAKVWHFASERPGASWPQWGRTEFYENPGALPRAWIVNNAAVLESSDERLGRIAKGPWDPRKTVILESYPNDAPPLPTEQPAGHARVLARGADSYEIEAENEADAYLVLSEAYYPGWTADIDGRAAEVLPANHLIQTIRLPAGRHLVHFRYRSRFLAPGLFVAALAALAPIGLLIRRNWRQLPLQGLPRAP
ncbi:MAG TPA: YfhO family protein [Planctomycetota bacterium]|nr:YfhO family protein [Planctomycetota bacterium]